jgi:hypothetical protein
MDLRILGVTILPATDVHKHKLVEFQEFFEIYKRRGLMNGLDSKSGKMLKKQRRLWITILKGLMNIAGIVLNVKSFKC